MVSDKKTVKCIVQTIDSILTFNIQQNFSGKELLEQACEALNITESWWFGLLGTSKKNYTVWVEDRKKVNLSDLKPYPETESHVKLCIKYYPEDIKLEILTSETKKYFFKSEVQRHLTGEVVIAPDHIVAYLVAYLKLVCSQRKDLNARDVLDKRFDRLMPQHIASQYSQSKDEWMAMILSTYELYDAVHVGDVIDNCLSLMENSHMYGVCFYEIRNRKGTPLLLGVDSLGLYIYTPSDKINPKVGFPWGEVHCVAFEDKKFTISPVNKSSPPLVIYSPTPQQNEELLHRIDGNHEKYIQRRQPHSANSAQFNKAMALKDIETSERNRFEQQKDSNAAYNKVVDKLLSTAKDSSDQNVKNQMDKEYQKAIKAMEERIEEAERIAKQEREKQKKDSKEAEELRKRALELEKKIESEKSAREAMALVESQLSTQAELKALEVERLAAEMEKLKLKHEEDLSRLKNLNESQSSSEQGSNTAKTYSEIKMAAQVSAQAKLKSVGDQLKKAQVSGREVTDAIEKNRLEGKDKFKTLELVRKGNTKTRVDEFEAL